MPYQNMPESQWGMMDKCKEHVMGQGHDEQSAMAICYASITKGDPFPEGIKPLSLKMSDDGETILLGARVKMGARNNSEDRGRLREIRKKAKEIIEHSMILEPDDEEKNPAAKADGLTVYNVKAQTEGGTIKAAGDWELDVLGVPFGGPDNGKDADGQYFSAETQTYQDYFKTIPVFYYHGYSPDGRPMGEPVQIGTAKYERSDTQGHWYRVLLDKGADLAKRIWDAAKNGIARASSGSVAHLVRVARDGFIQSWPVAELSLIDEGEKRHPANGYAIATPVMKSHFESAGLEMPVIPESNQPEAAETAAESITGSKSTKSKEFEMENAAEVQKLIADALSAQRAADEAAAKAKAERQAEIDSAVKAQLEAKEKEWAAKHRLPGGGMPYVAQFSDTDKFDNLSAAELGMVIDTLKSVKTQPSQGAIKALMFKVAHIENDKVSNETAVYAKGALKSFLGVPLTDEAIKATTADVMYTAGSSHLGEDWVGTAYSNQLWEKIRANANVAGKIPTVVIPDGFASKVFPLESTDPTWYEVAQASTTDDSMGEPSRTVTKGTIVTDDTSITVNKMGAAVVYSGEMTEDSLIAFVPQAQAQLTKSGAEMMEHVVIDGDTATSSNINDIGGTTYSGNAASLFLHTNGFRKVGIANGRSAAGAFSVEDFLATIQKIGTNGIGISDPSQCAFIVDPNTWFAAAKLPEAKDRNQTVLDVSGGFVRNAYAVPVIPSWQMHYRQTSRLANTAGKVDLNTAGNNLYGAICAVRFDLWKLGYKRRMTMETTRFAKSDSWEITALSRWGLIYRDSTAAAVTYYLGI